MEKIITKNNKIPCEVDICMSSWSYRIEVNGLPRDYCEDHMHEFLSFISTQFSEAINSDGKDCLEKKDLDKNNIELHFNDDVSVLSGSSFGESIYLNQVRDNIDWSVKNNIVFPSYIKAVSISFVHGLLLEILEGRNISFVLKYFDFTGNDAVVKKILKAIYY